MWLNILAGLLIVFFISLSIFYIRNHLTSENSKSTIIIMMAIIIFTITMITVIKTYTDYQIYIDSRLSENVLSNISFAIFLDFSVLIIGGLFLYLSNQLYIASKRDETRIQKLEALANEHAQQTLDARKKLKKQRKQFIKSKRQPKEKQKDRGIEPKETG